MSQHLTPDSLDELLRQPSTYLDDAGFTARVMDALPGRRADGRVRRLFVLGSTLFALALGLFVLPAGRAALNAAMVIVTPLRFAPRGLEAVMLAFGQIPPATLVLGFVAMVLLVWGGAALARE